MKKALVPLCIAACLLVLGVCLLIIGFALNGWKSFGVLPIEQTTQTYDQPYSSVEIDCEILAVEILPSEDSTTKIEYPVHPKIKVSCSVENGKLVLHQENLSLFSFWFRSPKITLSIAGTPSVYAKTDTGAISLKNLSLGDCELRAQTGAVRMERCAADRVTIHTDTGAAKLVDITANSLDCKTDTGAQTLKIVTATTVTLEADTGSIRAERLSASFLTAEADTGSIHLNIVGKKEEYSVWVDVDLGSKNISNQAGTTEKTLNLRADTGSVHVTFEN